jgi:hypothetical protein
VFRNLCHVCGVISLSSWLGLWFLIFGLVQVLFLINFKFFDINYPVTTLRIDLISGAYLNKLLFPWCPLTENNSALRVNQVTCFFKKSDNGRSPKKEDCCQLLKLCFVLLDFVTLEDGTKRLSRSVGTESPLSTA